ncbi:STAS domain-containing protein [Crateriforma conspicua]|uniref:STAS domain-containing protein n=1 Tax=Crateriforma conspicua TaxID=2527996 RepID=UPI00118D3F07|nr:STAS domain-containing protein [Crateriforma conspicua]QDV65456.1 hypothetical protein Mal65_46270 [Crateriforma conspicua]
MSLSEYFEFSLPVDGRQTVVVRRRLDPTDPVGLADDLIFKLDQGRGADDAVAGSPEVILDLHRSDSVSTRGIGMLFHLHQVLVAGGRRFRILDAPSPLMRMIRLLNLQDVFDVQQHHGTTSQWVDMQDLENIDTAPSAQNENSHAVTESTVEPTSRGPAISTYPSDAPVQGDADAGATAVGPDSQDPNERQSVASEPRFQETK